MALAKVNPTRMELTRTKRRLATADRGHKLLKDKQDEMVRQFITLVRRNEQMRRELEPQLVSAQREFAMARALMDGQAMEAAVMTPAVSIEVEASTRNIMSVRVPALRVKQGERSDTLPYGFADTSAQLDHAVATITQIMPRLIELAEVEKTCERLADEIEKTRRRVNALEYVMIPQMHQTVRTITMKLEENERGNISRLMKVKEMIADKQ